MRLTIAATSLAISMFAVATPAAAEFYTVNLDEYVNSYVSINPHTLPIGTSTGNQGTGIPFQVSSAPQNSSYSGVWLSSGAVGSSVTVDLTSYNITGAASFYALLNNYYGTYNVNEYSITIASATQSVTYESIGGVDTRDYNANVYTNTIADTTTEWFNNGIGQRYDVRTFSLPDAFANDTITSFTITQVRAGDHAIFAGLTFSTLPAGVVPSVPEPSTYGMLALGLGVMGFTLRRRKQATVSA